MKIGIDKLAIDFPKIFLSIEDFAKARDLEVAKLQKGLGLHKMSIPDTHQDTVTFAANACKKLLEQIPDSEWHTIDRLYIGTESGVDSSKPVATFVLGCLQQVFANKSFSHWDAVDYKFACIGAVDAFQNSLDYVRLHPTKKAIVIASDVAKYDLESGGEYTQGAGAVALLISANPKIISFQGEFGVATQHEFDFFKPRRNLEKSTVSGEDGNPDWHGVLEEQISIYKEQPIFDGHYSNTCYIRQIQAAYSNFALKNPDRHFDKWQRIAMHLPYCFQGRRTFMHIIAQESPQVISEFDGESDTEKIRSFSKSEYYKKLITEKLEPAERASGLVGNIYTGSIFLALASILSDAAYKNTDLEGRTIGFIAYGSGAKAKVFEGTIEANWKTSTEKMMLFSMLKDRKAIDFSTYVGLHKKEKKESCQRPQSEFILEHIENESPNLIGARYYKWID